MTSSIFIAVYDELPHVPPPSLISHLVLYTTAVHTSSIHTHSHPPVPFLFRYATHGSSLQTPPLSSPPPFPQFLPPFLGHIQCSFLIVCARELSFIPQERVERPTFDLEATWEVSYFVRVRAEQCCEEYGVSRMSGFYLRCLTAKYGVRVDNGR
jgi:hypothetical protein